jgi:hypothetical protein
VVIVVFVCFIFVVESRHLAQTSERYRKYWLELDLLTKLPLANDTDCTLNAYSFAKPILLYRHSLSPYPPIKHVSSRTHRPVHCGRSILPERLLSANSGHPGDLVHRTRAIPHIVNQGQEERPKRPRTTRTQRHPSPTLSNSQTPSYSPRAAASQQTMAPSPHYPPPPPQQSP